MLLFLPTLLARSYISATMSQHIRKPYGSAVPLFIFFLLVDVGVSDGNVSEENATLSHRRTQVPLLTTLEPWQVFVTQTPAKEKAKEGETVVLNCHFNSPQHRSLTGLTARWYKEDEKGKTDLQENNMTMLPNNSRVFMSGDLSQGAVSLVILNVTTSDHGIYFCEVTLPDGKVMTGDGDKAEDQEGSRLVWYRRIYWNNHWGCGSWYRRPGSSDYHFNATAKEMHPLHETRLSPSIA
ncbi:uncharacterized protein LOC107320165 isoform X2 [Coturnix japonica]|uniref:Uncharacterized LOC107320165 n=1 Tax=Coturnix japonica TaxID=93934 RepID=A0A8C2U610_COTJA|nr:uncharacterized protein LOC107320165 isoform X2 [Coturnix japonica]